jgi:hypothetical protein
MAKRTKHEVLKLIVTHAVPTAIAIRLDRHHRQHIQGQNEADDGCPTGQVLRPRRQGTSGRQLR